METIARKLKIHIKRWAAWAPGIEQPAAWRAWAEQQHQVSTEVIPPKPELPAMLRRRLSTAGRIALHCANQCIEPEQQLPTIFCSRHGEMNRTIDMLNDLAAQQPLSPTAFSLSVHNANSGIFSIARNDHSPSSAISAAEDSLMMGLTEAAGWLAEMQHREVLVVFSDEPLPPPLSGQLEELNYPYGVAFLISRDEGECFTFACSTAQATPGVGPQALQLLRQLLSTQPTFTISCSDHHWQWQRCDA